MSSRELIAELTYQRDNWRAEAERRGALLTERVAIDNIAVPTEDGPMCCCCGAMWDYDDDTSDVKPGTEWHNDDCWVVRVRAEMEGIAETQQRLDLDSPAVLSATETT